MSFFDSLQDTAGNVITDIFYTIAFVIDNVVFSFIPRLYSLIISLANVDLFTNNTAILAFMNRIYVLIGVFMLFKLAFSFIRYIIDPNSFSDQTKGFTSLVKRVLIALVLLVSTPWLFGKAYELQGIIIDSNIIPKVILGVDDSANDDIASAAKNMQFLIFSPFFSVNAVGDLESCSPALDANKDKPLSNIIGTSDMALAGNTEGECLEAFGNAMNDDDSVKASNVSIKDFFETDSGDYRNFGSFGSLTRMMINNNQDSVRAIIYHPVVSTICGGYLAFLILSFCIDIAARAIKLMFLQILSPIAIVSSIDPTSSSQNERLKDWGKECLNTFLSLFIRLAVIYLIVQLTKIITARIYNVSSLYYSSFNRDSVSGTMNIFVYVFLIMGAFQVAKKIPELLEKALGIKFSGELNLNPLKNSFVAGATGLGVGAVAGGMAGLVAGSEAGAPIRGLLGGVTTGGIKGIGAKPSFGMLGDLRRKTYKDMTGNDFRSFNPVSKVFGLGGKKKVENLKDVINFGRDQLNKEHSKLNAISSLNADRRIKLSQAGIDPESKSFTDLMEAENKIKGYRDTVANLQKKRDEMLNNQGMNINSAEVITVSQQIAKAMSDEANAQSEFNKLGSALNISSTGDANYVMGKEYLAGVAEEDEIRGNIGKIEKDISTLDDQKRQMEHFYQVDSSPKQSVIKALDNIEQRDPAGFAELKKNQNSNN